MYWVELILFLKCAFHVLGQSIRPHIIVIVADDLGWNDVGFHGSNQIPTPNLDALAFNGVMLNRLYTLPSCTPSRAALLTGRHPAFIGMQGDDLTPTSSKGLPLEYKLMPAFFRDLGYKTHGLGKWHLGYSSRSYGPLARGFNSFFGFHNAYSGYYDYMVQNIDNDTAQIGLDIHRDGKPAWDVVGNYSTDVFGDAAVKRIASHNANLPLFLYVAFGAVHAGNPARRLEAPQDLVNRFKYILDPNRRVYAAMVSKLDEVVGRITESLKKKGMLKNSIILFMSDNGSPGHRDQPFYNWGSNYPLRGGKGSLWEGGVRSCSFIWSPQLQSNPRVSNQLFHVSDILPTLYTAAGGNQGRLPADLDGNDQWYSLTWNIPSRRSMSLVNFNEKKRTAAILGVFDPPYKYGALWKLVVGRTLGGQSDGIFNDVASFANPLYNFRDVINSTAYRAISSLFPSPASEFQMRALREDARVSCPVTNGPNPDCRAQPCLFDVVSDPCETNDLTAAQPQIAGQLYEVLKYFKARLVPEVDSGRQPALANPYNFNNTWTHWTLLP